MPASNLNHWKTDPEYIELLSFIIERTENVKSPIYIQQLIRDFKEKSETALSESCLKSRIDKMRTTIHSFEHIETDKKVRMLFALSAPVDRDFLKNLSNDAHVEVDGKNRITHYKSESLELKGYHRLSTAYDTKPYWISDEEGIDLLNYLIKETENVKSPMNLAQLARGFKRKSGAFHTAKSLRMKFLSLRTIIHSFDHIDTNTKVKLMFALSAPVNRDFLQKLSNEALVDVDENNRITHYKSESLELKGYHKLLTTCDIKSYWKNDMECIDLLNYLIEESENVKSPMNLAQLARDFKEKSGTFQTAESLEYRIIKVRFIIHSFDHIGTNTKVKLLFALSGPVNSYFLRELKKAINGGLELRGDHSLPAKRSMKRTFSSPHHSSLEPLFDYDTNNSIEDQVKLEPFRGEIQIPKPTGTPIKIEVEEPIEVKPETSHNLKIKFFEAMQSLILFLNTPSLSWIQSKIYQKIQKLEGPNEVILNNKIVLIIELLISRMINHSVVNLSNNVESVKLSNFLCYLEAAILNSKMSGVEGLVQNISKLTEESQNKRILMEKVENAVCATLDIDGF
ncbi:unnamed protein product [Caenorhabditis brenneri]